MSYVLPSSFSSTVGKNCMCEEKKPISACASSSSNSVSFGVTAGLLIYFKFFCKKNYNFFSRNKKDHKWMITLNLLFK